MKILINIKSQLCTLDLLKIKGTVSHHVPCSSALINSPYRMVVPYCLVDHSISELSNSLSICLWPYLIVSLPTEYEPGLMRT